MSTKAKIFLPSEKFLLRAKKEVVKAPAEAVIKAMISDK
jgi:hypothetical protein